MAFEVSYPPILGVSLNNVSTFPEYAKYFFNFGIAISITLATLVIIFGGIYYLISLGRGAFTDEGKEWIKAGVLGLFLILGAYLIVYTINPDLTIFKLNSLDPVSLDPFSTNTPSLGQKTTTFNEIPIGATTEQLLAKQIGCYAFDEYGNPIKGNRIKAIPCADKTCSSVAPGAREEWIDAPTFVKNDRVDCALKLEAGIKAKLKQIKDEIIDPVIDVMNNNCACTGASTTTPNALDNTNYFCDATCNLNKPCDTSKDSDGKCGEGENQNKKAGDKCPGNCSEKACKPKGRSDKLCCQNPDDTKKQIEEALKKLRPDPSHQSLLSDLEKSYFYGNNDDGYISIFNFRNWAKLNLGEQFDYLTNKLKELKQNIEDNSKLLGSQATQLSRCYFAMPSVDLANLIKQTNQKDHLILVNGTGSLKYCKAFNYSNSSCYKKCQDMCPDNQSITSCENAEDCLKNKTCPNSPFGSFADCMGSCKNQCQETCIKIHPENSSELSICQDQCENNSKCLLENSSSCLYSLTNPNKCNDTIENRDPENLDFCINRSYYSCKYGSYQNAGYADCANGYACAKTSGSYPPLLKSDVFSSSYLFKNLDKQRCQGGLQQCFTNKNTTELCSKIYPETVKCPALSNCPLCPCTNLENKQISFTPLPKKESRCEDNNEGAKYSFTATGYQIVGSECGEYAFNGDPLTFYCQQDWWNNDKEKRETPMGKERFCSKDSEVPVGQTIDEAQKWAGEFIQKIDKFTDTIEKEVYEPIRKALEHIDKKDYCKCDSKKNKDACCVNNCEEEPACITDCKFTNTTTTDEEGNTTDKCACSLTPCSGQPCQQMIDLLTKVSNAYNRLIEPYGDLFVFFVVDQRSDVFKKLTYSREKTNTCSVVRNSYGTQVKFMPCSRIEDEIIPPTSNIDNYCYGEKLGKLSNTNLNDNWFCCQMANPEQAELKSQ